MGRKLQSSFKVIESDELDQAEQVKVEEEGRVGVEDLTARQLGTFSLYTRMIKADRTTIPLITGLCNQVVSAWPRISWLSVVHDC